MRGTTFPGEVWFRTLGPARGTAGAHIAELIKTMLEKKASGIDLK